jgi:hypothetical protein
MCKELLGKPKQIWIGITINLKETRLRGRWQKWTGYIWFRTESSSKVL